jgi:long-chain acyl-CoA synthetase
VLEAFERKLREQLDAVPSMYRSLMDGLAGMNLELTRKRPNRGLSKRLLKPVHDGFGGHLEYLFCGGAFVDRARAEFFYKLGIPVVIGYGLTETCTVATVNDLRPFRSDTVGKPVPGVEIRIVEADDSDASDERHVGEVQIRGRTVMQGYLDDPELTAESFDGDWFCTGDRGWVDAAGHLHLVGRSKNMIVTEGGKNIYPEDVESAFESLDVEELCVFAADYIWPRGAMTNEELLIVVRPKDGSDDKWREALRLKNRSLSEHKRLHKLLVWDVDFDRTASLKVKRKALAESLRTQAGREQLLDLEVP